MSQSPRAEGTRAGAAGSDAAGAGENDAGGEAGNACALRKARVGYLGPEGTFSEEALLSSAAEGAALPVPFETIYDAAIGLLEGAVEFSILPIENSLDGTITVTLDLLVEHVSKLQILGDELLQVRHCLIAPPGLRLYDVQTVLTHPQVPGQCRGFLRSRLSHAEVLAASSTADAVRIAVQRGAQGGTAAIGTKLAGEIYGGVVLEEGIQDRDDNVTRFVWVGRTQPEGGAPAVPLAEGALRRPRKTSIVLWGAGADEPGWLLRCLEQFARRGLNLTKIESRPLRKRLGHYMFFLDVEGDRDERDVAVAITGLSSLCEEVLVLGSYPAASVD